MPLGMGVIQANVVSTTAAMSFSFVANKRFVFRHRGGSWCWQLAVFLGITVFGLYVLQNGIIALLTSVWPAPMQQVVLLVHAMGLGLFLSDSIVVSNGAKVVATVVSLTWNYIWYQKVVFAHG